MGRQAQILASEIAGATYKLKERSMRNYLMKSLLALACLALVVAPMPVKAAGAGMWITVSPTSVLAGEWAGVSAVISNNSSSKMRVTVTFSAVDTCGTKMDLGYNRLALAAGQSVLVTTAYPTSSTACRGMHTVTVSSGGSGGGKGGSTGASASAYLEVL
jgi:hypothetical protein